MTIIPVLYNDRAATLRLFMLGVTMIVMQAKLVIAQNADYAAIRDPAMGALDDHALKLGLQGLQPADTGIDGDKLTPGDLIGGGAGDVRSVGKAQQFADRLQRKAQVAGMADEGQPLLRFLPVKPLISDAALGVGQQADLLVIADGRHFHPGGHTEFTD